MSTTDFDPQRDPTANAVGCGGLVRLGVGRGRTHCEEVLGLRLKVGDTIRGMERYTHGWNEVRLCILWIGEKVVVYRKQWRAHYLPDKWIDDGETANFTLSCREWRLEQNDPDQRPGANVCKL